MKVTVATSKNQLIINALQAEIDRAKRKRLIARKGTLDLDIDLLHSEIVVDKNIKLP